MVHEVRPATGPGVTPLRFIEPDWRLHRVHALTTERQFEEGGASLPPFDRFNLGSHCGDQPEAVERNRRLLADRLHLPAAPRWLQQVHGIDVVRFDAEGEDTAPIADAAVTSTPGTVLAVLSADCLPVLFAAVDGSEVAAAHAGWRGLAAGVLEATIAAMDIAPERLLAWMGPAAGPFAYEVGEEVRDAFMAHDASSSAAFAASRPGHWWCDLWRLARRRLSAAGVGRISGGGHCTITEAERFYSHRRDRRTGRMASLVWIDPSR
jgi:polyphenol oxidase